jgi:hypothetical protein
MAQTAGRGYLPRKRVGYEVTMRRRLTVVVVVGFFLSLGTGLATATEPADELAKPFVSGKTPPNAPSVHECDATGDPAANVRLDCDDPFPNNEPNIVVDPTDPLHQIVSSNDYGSCCDQYYTTFDAGATWSTGNMSTRGPGVTGSDPITVIDPVHGTAVHFSLNYHVSSGTPAVNGDVVASVSTDGGLTWEVPTVVGHGRGARFFIDKEGATVDLTSGAHSHPGRIYLTWTGFTGDARRTLRSPIVLSSSDDGGRSWTTPHEISGSSTTYCTFQTSGPAGQCDEDQFSYPVVTPDGAVHVAFQNGQHEAAWEPGDQFESQYLVVSSTDGGATFADPVHVADQEDGTLDFPTNDDDRPTLTGMAMRVPSGGNIAADPRAGTNTLYVTWTDNSQGTHDVATPVTRARVFVAASHDGGATWNAPAQITPLSGAGGDQWFPWADVAPDGTLGVIYNQRTGADTYAADLAELSSGATTVTRLSNADSDINQSRYFQEGSEDCATCALFHGDYLGLDYDLNGVANGVWTDMRDLDPDNPALHLQFIYFGRH